MSVPWSHVQGLIRSRVKKFVRGNGQVCVEIKAVAHMLMSIYGILSTATCTCGRYCYDTLHVVSCTGLQLSLRLPLGSVLLRYSGVVACHGAHLCCFGLPPACLCRFHCCICSSSGQMVIYRTHIYSLFTGHIQCYWSMSTSRCLSPCIHFCAMPVCLPGLQDHGYLVT